MADDRSLVVGLAESWVGKDVHKLIVDLYNSWYLNTRRKVKMQMDWFWCACTWSAIAIKLGLTDKMPVEISCAELIKIAKEMGIWQENDAYIPAPGDAVLYDWDDDGKGDNTSWPDHIGTVTYVNKNSGYFVVVEGNNNNAVRKRTVSFNGRYIRGFITPKYDENPVTVDLPEGNGKTVNELAHEVISGVWGSGESRRIALESYGYNYREVQDKVNEILNASAVKPSSPIQPVDQPTSKTVKAACYAKRKNIDLAGTYEVVTDLYLRNDAGNNKKALCVMPKGLLVTCYGYYNNFNDKRWYYVEAVVDGVKYIGFCHSDYLRKISK